MIEKPGSTRQLSKKGWRKFRPLIHDELCVRCRLCWMFCPDSAIFEVEGDFYGVGGRKYNVSYRVNEDYCKGCGICANECPTRAIEMVREE